jgi:hypothetical protein
METFEFIDLLDGGPPRKVRALVTMQRDVPAGVSYRPNHNFGAAENREYYIGQIEVPAGGLQSNQPAVVQITFLNGTGLDDALVVGRKWRIQEGPKLVGSGEVLEAT